MSLLRWLRQFLGLSATSPATSTPDAAHGKPSSSIPEFPDGWGPLSAVGESQYQPALQRIAKRGRVCWATLLPEPNNPFDTLAVCVKVEGHTVAYLSRSDARRYQSRLLTLPQPMQVPAKLIGGTHDKPSFGILLDCRAVERIPKPKATRKKNVVVDPNDQPF